MESGFDHVVHDEVVAKIAAHRAAILADLTKPKSRRRVAATNQRRRPKPAIAGERSLFGRDRDVRESYGQTRDRLAVVAVPPRASMPMMRNETIRCVDCDHGLVVRSVKVICPKCGAIFGDERTLKALRDAFPGTAVIRESDLP